MKTKIFVLDIRNNFDNAEEEINDFLKNISKDKIVSATMDINANGKLIYSILYDDKKNRLKE